MHPSELFEQPPNVKELGLETEAKPELRFDPERDLTEEDWENIIYSTKLGGSRGIIRVAATIYEMDPNHCPDIPSEKVSHTLDSAREAREKHAEHVLVWKWPIYDVAALHTLRPDIDLNIGSYEESGLKEYLAMMALGGKERRHAFDQLFLAEKIHKLFPEADFQITKREWNEIWDWLKIAKCDNDWNMVARTACKIVSLDPNQKIEISDEEWESMKGTLENLRVEKDWGTFAEMARSMTHLARWQGNGQISRSKEGLITPLPEVRTF